MSKRRLLNPIAPAISLAATEATPTQRRALFAACLFYAVMVLALLPFAVRSGPTLPHITGIYATAVLVADLCTYALLAAQFRASTARWLLVLASAYLYSALMALLHFLTFPGAAIPDGPVLGRAGTVSWLYLFWSLGFVTLLGGAVFAVPPRAEPAAAVKKPGRALAISAAGIVAVIVLLFVLSTTGLDVLPALTVGDRFSAWGIAGGGLRGLLAALALVVLWRTGRGTTIVPMWLSLIFLAAATGPLLTDLGGRRYTVGWYAGRASFALASWVLLIVMIAEFVRLQTTLGRVVRRLEGETQALSAEVQRREAAETASRGKDEFLAMLSHELRNPIGAIRMAIAVLNASTDRPDVALRARDVIGRQTNHLARLIDDLLDVTRVINGKVMLVREPFDLAEAVRRAVATATPDAQSAAATVQTVPVRVNGDVVRIEQVVTNILGNAVRYTPANGRIDVSLTADGPHAVLTVKDTGIGIPTDMLPRIFDLFVQGPQGLERRLGGLGIGLTLSRQLVEAHGGTVTATSEGEGRGSIFTVRLPRIPDAAALPTEPADRASAGARRSVLVVEDNADAREMLTTMLTLAGHEVHEAPDGATALAMVPPLTPDVSVLDIGLPEFDGYELARRLRAREAGRAMVLIAVTGYGQPADYDRAMAAGFDAHLTKPVSADRLLALIDENCERRRSVV